MSARVAGGRAQRSAPWLGLIVLAAMACAAVGSDPCPDTTFLKQRKADDTKGHFLSATISWTHVSGNKVKFEVISTWRRKHYWPCKAGLRSEGAGFSGPDGWPGLGDDLTVVGLSTVDTGQARQEAVGTVSTKLGFGDGNYRELHLTVTSFSVEEDWLMGVSYIEHEYQTPYRDKVPVYAIDGQKLHYVSSPGNRANTEPFQTVPWTAEFTGCCRRFVGKADVGKADSPNFSIKATVDLSNHVASPRLVLMPFIFMSTQGSRVAVCALSAGGRKAMVRKNGGTINYKPDDNTPAKFSFSAKASSVTVVSANSKDGRCTMLAIGQNPQYQSGDIDVLSVEVKMGDAMVQGDYLVYVMGPDRIGASVPSSGPFGCQLLNLCEDDVSLGKRFAFNSRAPQIDFESTANPKNPLEIRYIVATPTSQSSLLATSQGAVQYAVREIDQDHAGLPHGAKFSPVLNSVYVTDITVVFTANEKNTRPRVDQFISNDQRDYTDKIGLNSRWLEVENSDFNCLTPSQCFGGAHISVYIEKALSDPDPTQLGPLVAITGIQLANPSQVADFESKGYQKLHKNLLEQSDRGTIYIMYKKGSGPPVMDVSATPKPGYHMITASTSHSQGQVATATLYVMYSPETRVSRGLIWSPCTGQDEEVIVCAAATALNVTIDANTPLAFGAQMQCVLMDVVPTAKPLFTQATTTTYKGYMGKELEIALTFKRQDRPLSALDTVPSIRFGIKGDVHTEPMDSERVLDMLTGRTKTGARILNADKTGTGLSVDVQAAQDNANIGESKGFLLWTPSPYQGGWSGEICLDACVNTSACPAHPGGPVEVCSQTCFHVKVDRCKWALQGEDSFVEIAPRFQTNWLQLWFLNPMVGHPDHASALSNQVQPETMVNVGRIYKPRWDDTMASVAERFGMSVQRLIDLNADLANITDANFIKDGEERELCVIPDSCTLEAPSNSGKNS